MKLSERNAAVYREKSSDELRQEILQLKQEKLNFSFQKANKELQSPTRVRWVRRKIAMLETVLKEKAA